MEPLEAYSPDYVTARQRFRTAATAAGARLEALSLPLQAADGTPLTIDVALLGSPTPRRAVVVSSGTHGVEGFFGAAVQLGILAREDLLRLPDDCALVLIHAVNPFGFDRVRRVNEDNVDLNRSFLTPAEAYTGSPEGYRELEALLNPASPPEVLDLFLPRMASTLATKGLSALKSAIAQGQYDYPRGLFFGGSRPNTTVQLLGEALPRWLGGAERVVHLDLHTGRGRWGDYVLAVPDAVDSPAFRLQQRLFGDDRVEGFDPRGVLYEIRGSLGAWCAQLIPGTAYHCLLAEFGSHWIIEVLLAMRYENRAWHYTEPDDPRRVQARDRLREVFCPADVHWRRATLAQALTLVAQARQHLTQD